MGEMPVNGRYFTMIVRVCKEFKIKKLWVSHYENYKG